MHKETERKRLIKNNGTKLKRNPVRKSIKHQNTKGKKKLHKTSALNRKGKQRRRNTKGKQKQVKASKMKQKGKNKKLQESHCHSAPCEFATMVPLIKKYTKVENTLMKLIRMVAWWQRLNDKSAQALDTFDSPYLAIAKATDGGTTCGGEPLLPTHQLAKTAHNELWKCSSQGSLKARNLC